MGNCIYRSMINFRKLSIYSILALSGLSAGAAYPLDYEVSLTAGAGCVYPRGYRDDKKVGRPSVLQRHKRKLKRSADRRDVRPVPEVL